MKFQQAAAKSLSKNEARFVLLLGGIEHFA
jgi:hypothetical protein